MTKFVLVTLVLVTCGALDRSVLAQEKPRYVVTYVRSQNAGTIRSATAVTVINQSNNICRVQVEWFLSNGDSVCTLESTINPGIAHHFCSRNLPSGITSCNPPFATQVSCPGLFGFQGTAIVSSTDNFPCSLIAVDARVYYTTPGDAEVSAISNSKVVFFGEGNLGD